MNEVMSLPGSKAYPEAEGAEALQWRVEQKEVTPELIRLTLFVENPPPPCQCASCGSDTINVNSTHRYNHDSYSVIIEGIPCYKCNSCSEKIEDEVLFCSPSVGNVVFELVHSPLRLIY